jgi:hypothetical protein
VLPVRDEPVLDEPLAEARRLIAAADLRNVTLRLLGGLAVHARVPSWKAPIDRRGRDIDLATRGTDRRAVEEILAAAGYEADRRHNALHGHTQLYFTDRRSGRPVDVLIDRFEMCHAFDFRDRLAIDPLTLPLAELLLSKLQIVQINRKDLVDITVLLAHHPLSSDDQGISLQRVTSLTGADWGWWRTVTGNLERVRAFVSAEVRPDEVATNTPPTHDPLTQVADLRAAIDRGRKSLGWRTRAIVGERAAWYDEPEEIAHGAD